MVAKYPGLPKPGLASTDHSCHCGLHKSDLSVQCNATTTRKVACRRTPKHFSAELLPMCGQHKDVQMPAGRCQATEECGQRCDSFTKADPPFHLCTRHANGTDTLPCYLLRIPKEVRLMIWRYIFPASISAYPKWAPVEKKEWSFASLLKVNRQIGEEAAYVLYGEALFDVEIQEDFLKVCRRSFTTNGRNCTLFKGSFFDLDVQDVLPALKRIRNFDISIVLGLNINPVQYLLVDADMQSISAEDYHVSQIRHMLKQFIDIIRRQDSTHTQENDATKIGELGIRLEVGSKFNWGYDEMLSMTIMATEPFKALGHVAKPILHCIRNFPEKPARPSPDRDRFNAEYQAYASEWQNAMSQSSYPASGSRAELLQTKADQARKELRNIEDFASFLIKKGITVWEKNFWQHPKMHVFDGIPRVVHLARVAAEQYDLSNLATIRDVLAQRWVDYPKNQVREWIPVSNSLLNMFDGAEESGVIKKYRALFTDKQELKEMKLNRDWSELDVRRFVHDRTDPQIREGVTVWEDRGRRYLTEGDQCTVVLKTPFFVRRNRNVAV